MEKLLELMEQSDISTCSESSGNAPSQRGSLSYVFDEFFEEVAAKQEMLQGSLRLKTSNEDSAHFTFIHDTNKSLESAMEKLKISSDNIGTSVDPSPTSTPSPQLQHASPTSAVDDIIDELLEQTVSNLELSLSLSSSSLQSYLLDSKRLEMSNTDSTHCSLINNDSDVASSSCIENLDLLEQSDILSSSEKTPASPSGSNTSVVDELFAKVANQEMLLHLSSKSLQNYLLGSLRLKMSNVDSRFSDIIGPSESPNPEPTSQSHLAGPNSESMSWSILTISSTSTPMENDLQSEDFTRSSLNSLDNSIDSSEDLKALNSSVPPSQLTHSDYNYYTRLCEENVIDFRRHKKTSVEETIELNKLQYQKQKLREEQDNSADLLKLKLDAVMQMVARIDSQSLDFLQKLTSQNLKELEMLPLMSTESATNFADVKAYSCNQLISVIITLGAMLEISNREFVGLNTEEEILQKLLNEVKEKKRLNNLKCKEILCHIQTVLSEMTNRTFDA